MRSTLAALLRQIGDERHPKFWSSTQFFGELQLKR
jgi:hypothetical protein